MRDSVSQHTTFTFIVRCVVINHCSYQSQHSAYQRSSIPTLQIRGDLMYWRNLACKQSSCLSSAPHRSEAHTRREEVSDKSVFLLHFPLLCFAYERASKLINKDLHAGRNCQHSDSIQVNSIQFTSLHRSSRDSNSIVCLVSNTSHLRVHYVPIAIHKILFERVIWEHPSTAIFNSL